MCQFLIEEALLDRLELEELQSQRQAEEKAASDQAVDRSTGRRARMLELASRAGER